MIRDICTDLDKIIRDGNGDKLIEVCNRFSVIEDAPEEMTPDEQFAALQAYEKFWKRFEQVKKIKTRCIRLGSIGVIPENDLMDATLKMIHRRVGLVHNAKIYLGDLEILARSYQLSPNGIKRGLKLCKEHDFVIEDPTNWFRLNV